MTEIIDPEDVIADEIRLILTLNRMRPTEDHLFHKIPLLQYHDIGVPNLTCYADDLITQPRTRYMGTERLNIKDGPTFQLLKKQVRSKCIPKINQMDL